MITREKLEEILDEAATQFQDVDHDMIALTLLRQRIPYDVCECIINGAEHDQIYLCCIRDLLPYIDEADARVLSECNLFIDSDCNCLSMFV